MVKVGLAGIGFMGVTHFKAWQKVPGAQVAAICDSVEKRLTGDWTDIQGNFGEAGGVQDLTGITKYRELDEMLADDSLDLIDLCLPSRMHPDAVIASLRAGRHTMVEKPIAIEPAEAARMVACAEETGRLLMVGQVLRFFPEWRWLKQTVDAGTYGALCGLNLRRVISQPDWSQDMRNLAANGGPMIDLHIHDVDFLLYLLGKPKAVSSIGRHQDGLVSYIATNYVYDGPTVSCQSGAITMKGRMFSHQYEAYFERATAVHAVATEPEDLQPKQICSQQLTVYLPDGSVEFPEPPATEAFVAELSHVAECVASGTPSPIISGALAAESLRVTCLEAESVLSGKPVAVP